MVIQFVGAKIPQTGKTLWEIVGNLKNFGVGRLVQRSNINVYSELSFLKIEEVQPLPPPKEKFQNRQVLISATEVFRGRLLGVKIIKSKTEIPKFRLVPKMEEEELLQKAKELTSPIKELKKYCYCPPLYKILWEAEGLNEKMPRINAHTKEPLGFEVVYVDDEYSTSKCDLYKYDLTVDEMYKEIVRLKKIIKQNRAVEQQ